MGSGLIERIHCMGKGAGEMSSYPETISQFILKNSKWCCLYLIHCFL